MEREQIRQIFGINYIGQEELKPFFKALGFGEREIQEKSMEYSDSDLQKAAKEGYILIYGEDQVEGQYLTLRFFRDKFGVDPNKTEPCLYNQDWYLKEEFMDISLESRWYLIKKEVYEETRAVTPEDLTRKGLIFPPAILCAYTFFAYYYAYNDYIWWHDFVWCCDTDHNGDRIYVGKYHDIDGINKNGFSIHRHLALRPCYGSVNYIR